MSYYFSIIDIDTFFSALNLIQSEDYLNNDDVDLGGDFLLYKRKGDEVSQNFNHNLISSNEEPLDYINHLDDGYQPIRKRREVQGIPKIDSISLSWEHFLSFFQKQIFLVSG